MPVNVTWRFGIALLPDLTYSEISSRCLWSGLMVAVCLTMISRKVRRDGHVPVNITRPAGGSAEASHLPSDDGRRQDKKQIECKMAQPTLSFSTTTFSLKSWTSTGSECFEKTLATRVKFNNPSDALLGRLMLTYGISSETLDFIIGRHPGSSFQLQRAHPTPLWGMFMLRSRSHGHTTSSR